MDAFFHGFVDVFQWCSGYSPGFRTGPEGARETSELEFEKSQLVYDRAQPDNLRDKSLFFQGL